MVSPDSLSGNLLVASTLITEPVFARSVILVMEHNLEGAFGLVLNQPSEELVADHLPEWSESVAPPGMVYVGGPVEPEVGTGMCPGAFSIDSPLPGVSFLDLESSPTERQRGARIYSGYSGWGPGQLESELAAGSWYVVAASPDDPFSEPAGLWAAVLRRQPGQLAMVANFPPDPSMN
jgi:putative transcriptional regulator